jgi:hypothetical protein
VRLEIEGLRDTVQPTSDIDSDPRVSGLIARPHIRLQTNVPRRGSIWGSETMPPAMSNGKRTPLIADATAPAAGGRVARRIPGGAAPR